MVSPECVMAHSFIKNPEISKREHDGGGDDDDDTLDGLTVKFDRVAVQKTIERTSRTVDLVVTGEVADDKGTSIPFKGSDTVKIVK